MKTFLATYGEAIVFVIAMAAIGWVWWLFRLWMVSGY